MNLTEEQIATFTNHVIEGQIVGNKILIELVKFWCLRCAVLESEKSSLKTEALS